MFCIGNCTLSYIPTCICLCREGIFYQNGTLKPHIEAFAISCGGVTVPTPTTGTITTSSPTIAPVVIVNTTSPVTSSPTTTPTLLVVAAPTIAPTTSLTPTFRPTVNITSDPPTAVPILLDISTKPSTSNSFEESIVPSSVPSDVPTNEPDPSLCLSNNACSILDLVGQCCPTSEGITLLCCGNGIVEETCALNDQCAKYELTDGNCCPTNHADIPEIDNKYLDCCTVLPDECKIDINSTEAENSACQFMSTLDYKLLLQQSQSASRSAAKAIPGITITTTVMTCIATTMLLIVNMKLQ
jgi:hypothetical protein